MTNQEQISKDFAKALMKSGLIFTAIFIKANGEKRTLNGRCNVINHAKNIENAKPSKNCTDCLTVWECNYDQYRTINVNRLLALKIFGQYLEIRSS